MKRKAADATASLNRRRLIATTRTNAAQRAEAPKRKVGAPRSPFNQWIAVHKILLRNKGERKVLEQLAFLWGISKKAVKDAVKLGDADARAFLIAVADDRNEDRRDRSIQQNIDTMRETFRELGVFKPPK